MTGRTKSDARRKLRQLQRRLEDGLPTGNGSMTLGDFLERWLTDVLPARSQVQAKSTVTNYRWAAGHAIRGLGRRRLGELTPENVEALLRHLADQGMARNSVMRLRSVPVMALNHAQRRDLVARNVAELSEMPTSARDPRSGRSLTPEQARQLLDVAAQDRLGGLVTVGLMLGLRPGELCGLRWEDVDLDARVLAVTKSRKRTTDDDGREALVLGAPKTRKSRRAHLDPAIIRRDAQRMFDVYGTYGISVFALPGATIDELAQEAPAGAVPALHGHDREDHPSPGSAAGADRTEPPALHADAAIARRARSCPRLRRPPRVDEPVP